MCGTRKTKVTKKNEQRKKEREQKRKIWRIILITQYSGEALYENKASFYLSPPPPSIWAAPGSIRVNTIIYFRQILSELSSCRTLRIHICLATKISVKITKFSNLYFELSLKLYFLYTKLAWWRKWEIRLNQRVPSTLIPEHQLLRGGHLKWL